MKADPGRLARPLRWLYPGLGVKRWYALLFVGLSLLGVGAVLLFNLFAYDLAALVGGPPEAAVVGAIGIGVGLVAVLFGVRGMRATKGNTCAANDGNPARFTVVHGFLRPNSLPRG